MKLSEYAKSLGICYRTAWNMFNSGQIPNAYQLPTGTIIVPEINDSKIETKNRAIIYARVSSHKQKSDLESQIKRLENYASAKGYQIISTKKEIASGFNDNRKELNKILNENNFDILLVENKDRLTRIGFNYIDKFFQSKNKTIEVANMLENKDDMMTDLISIITSYCAKYYSNRRYINKKNIILKELGIENDE